MLLSVAVSSKGQHGVDAPLGAQAGFLVQGDLLAALAQQVDIRTFRECVPSMHDIFIQTVGADAATPKTNNA